MALVSDARLVEAARNGSNKAFEQLAARHQQALRSFLRGVCRNHARADDLAQDVLFTAWQKIGQLREGAAFRSWLMGMAYRQHLASLRSDIRRERREEAWVETEEQSRIEGIGSEEKVALEKAIRELSEDQRAAISLCVAQGFSHSEASEILNMPLGTLKSHINRGKARLLQVLGGGNDA